MTSCLATFGGRAGHRVPYRPYEAETHLGIFRFRPNQCRCRLGAMTLPGVMMTLIARFGACLLAVMMVLALSLQAQAASFMARDHLVVDLRFGVEWLRCTVGKVWNGETCVGEAVRLNHEQIEIAIEQASEQLGEGWRLPTLEELEGLVCEECGRPMIDADVFPTTEAEPYWTGEENGFSAKNYFFSVNFFNGWTFGRFPPSKPLAVRLVRDRN